MAYLVNSSRRCRISVGGTDYTNYLISWNANDSSYVENGIVTTGGQLILGDKPDRDLLKFYRRNIFKRGVPVICELANASGAFVRHPRGLLYVVASSYSPGNNQLIVEMACELGMAQLVQSTSSDYFSLSPTPITDDRRDMANLAAAFQAKGQFIWQDNTGTIQTTTAIPLGGRGTVPAASMTSVLGLTAESVEPLTASEPLPESIRLSYQVPSPPEPEEPEDGEIDTDGDGVPDYLDPDPNNPNIDGGDTDGDGVPDPIDPDPNNPNVPGPDGDGDGTPDDIDPSPDDPSISLDGLDGKATKSTVVSHYLTDYPTVIFERVPRQSSNDDDENDSDDPNIGFPDLGDIEGITPDSFLPPPVSVCGNEIPLPEVVYDDLEFDLDGVGGNLPGGGGTTAPNKYSGGGGGIATCNGNYKTVRGAETLSMTRTETTTTEYKGPGKQQDYQESIITSPLFEQNRQYYADTFAYCRSLHATACNPNGGCPYKGSYNIVTAKRTRQNYFNDEGTVIKVVSNQWNTYLSIAKPSDWRSGNNNGIPQDFQDDFDTNANTNYTGLFNSQRVIDEWKFDLHKTTQTTTTYTSIASAKGVGVSVGKDALDCMKGIVTKVVRETTGLRLNPPKPPEAGSPTSDDISGVGSGRVQIIPPPDGRFDVQNETITVKDEKGMVATVYVDQNGDPDPSTFKIINAGTGYEVGEVVRLTRDSNTDDGYIEFVVEETGPSQAILSYDDKDTIIVVTPTSQLADGTYVDDFVVDRQYPVQIQNSNRGVQTNNIGLYSEYLRKLAIGESLGLQITEPYRDELNSNWTPNMNIRYYDDLEQCLLAMQMDATSWGVSIDAAVYSTSALYQAKTNGIVSLPDNIENSATPGGFPTTDGGNTTPQDPQGMGGLIQRVSVTDVGSGYTTPGTYQVVVTSGVTGAESATLAVTILADGTISPEVTIVNPGTGFEINDVLTVPGADVGGISGFGSEGDITITAATPIIQTGQGSATNGITYDAEDVVDDGNYYETVDIVIAYGIGVRPAGKRDNGIMPPPLLERDTDWNLHSTMTCWVDGETVLAGAVLSVRTAGAIPLSQGTSIVTQVGDIVIADLFAPADPGTNGTNTGNGGGGNLP